MPIRELSEIEQQTGFKGAQLTVQSVFFDLAAGVADNRFDGRVPRSDESAGHDHRDHFPAERDEPDVDAADRGSQRARGANVSVAVSRLRRRSG